MLCDLSNLPYYEALRDFFVHNCEIAEIVEIAITQRSTKFTQNATDKIN